MYQKEIIYISLYKDGNRLGSAGFLKVENRERESRLHLKIQNIPLGISGRFPIRIYNGNEWKEINSIMVQDGGGSWQEDMVGAANRVILKVMLPGEYYLEGRSKTAVEMTAQRKPDIATEKTTAREMTTVTEKTIASEVATVTEKATAREIDAVTEKATAREIDAATEKATVKESATIAEKNTVSERAAAKKASTMEETAAAKEESAVEEMAAVKKESAVEEMTAVKKKSAVEERNAVKEINAVEETAATKEESAMRQMDVARVESDARVTDAVVEERAACKTNVQRETIIIKEELPRRKTASTFTTPQSMPEHSLKEDKWEQILDTYENIHPYGDERVYVKVEPKDFVILQSKYQHLVNNSFLLHGFYNYRYIILGKEQDYYLGVPGVFYEREKMVALMFGFEAFECPGGNVKAGEFGYYLRKVEI